MSKTINYGVDLGTTNSALSKFDNGKVETLANPGDQGRRTLPSIVGYKKDSVVVGTRAKVAPDKFAAFKRKMGTTESFKVKSLGETKTPVDFSAEILKEIKKFTDEKIEALVITVPASFNSVQSEDTRNAAIQAGIKQVSLLQEPIAASLAYANGKKLDDSTFLVYDLGGGTFDVALVKVTDGELKVIDNEGDNFLGGHDFDQLIVDNLIIPHIEKETGKENLAKAFKSKSNPLNKYLFTLLDAAETAKIELSSRSSSDISSQIIIDGEEFFVDLSITQSDFNGLIKDSIEKTCDKVNAILTRNSMDSSDLDFVLMVGGSTFIPYVRTRTSELLKQEVKTDIDPTTAISVGAAFFAGTKTIEVDSSESKSNSDFDIKIGYPKSSKDSSEDVLFKVLKGFDAGFSYEVARGDNAFSTGKVTLSEKFDVELPLIEDSYNSFTLNVTDSTGNKVYSQEFGINSGVAVSGQPLTFDVSVEVDDENNPGETKLRQLLAKGTSLPNRTKWVTTINKKLVKGDENDAIQVNVFEGPSGNIAIANQLVGNITITGKDIHMNIIPGSEIEIRLSVTEDRTYTCEATLLMTEQTFKSVFKSDKDSTTVDGLQSDINDLSDKLNSELKQAEKREDYETCQSLQDVKKSVDSLSKEANDLSKDDVTDKKRQLAEEKRAVAQSISDALKDKRLNKSVEAFNKAKDEAEDLVSQAGNDYEQTQLRQIISNSGSIISTKNIQAIDDLAENLKSMTFAILRRMPDFVKAGFAWLISEKPKMSNQDAADMLINSGKAAAAQSDWDKLSQVNAQLAQLLPRDAQNEAGSRIGF